MIKIGTGTKKKQSGKFTIQDLILLQKKRLSQAISIYF